MDRDHFITPATLKNRLGEPGLSIICNFMPMPGSPGNGYKEFEQERIPGAVYFDIDEIADQSSNLPHMIADSAQFSAQMGRLGVSADDDIVVYDGPGLFSSARVWWNLILMGARSVRILEGGFNSWKNGNYPVDTGPAGTPEVVQFNAQHKPGQVINSAQLLELINLGRGTILDARSLSRFEGTAQEPRKGLRSGHMPGAKSLPFVDLIEKGSLLEDARLKEILKPLLVDGEPIVTTCGSGVTAAVLSLALTCAGYQSHQLFDGSWTEWGDENGAFPIIGNEDRSDG